MLRELSKQGKQRCKAPICYIDIYNGPIHDFATDMPRAVEYLGPLGSSAGHCMTLGIHAYKIDPTLLAKRANVATGTLTKYDYYLIKGSPGFKTEVLSRDHKIDLGARRAELRFSLDHGIAVDRFPEKEEERHEKEVEYNYSVTVSAKGEVEFKPVIKGSVGPEAKWCKVTKFKTSTINTYCYSIGKLTATPGWVFEPREGENHLEAEKELGLTVQIPKVRGRSSYPSGCLKMFCHSLVLLDENHKQLSLPQKIVARIKGLVLRDRYYKGVEFNFPMAEITRGRKLALSITTAPRPRFRKPVPPRPLMHILSNRTLELVEKELTMAKAHSMM